MQSTAEEVPCRRCGSPSAELLVATDRNRVVSDERFTYRRCTACGVVWLPDPPDDLGRYYTADYHDFLDSDGLERAASLEHDRVAMLRRHVRPGPVVEIGPSQGIFSSALRDAGFPVTALEMDRACCEHLERLGFAAVNTQDPVATLADLPASRAVVLLHVIEHVPDPWALIAAIASNLEPGGALMLATPNPASLQFHLFGRRWVHLDAPRHLTLIPLAALRDSAAAAGLSLVEATYVDRVGLACNRLGWARSPLSPPALRPDPRVIHTTGTLLNAVAGPFERRGDRGTAYTAVFRRPG